jgi:hypothetical protein
MASDNCLKAMAREWYGYGRWEAPHWFIGPEPGNPEGDNLKERCAAWNKLGRGELVDCECHHVEFGWKKWHQQNPPTQPTWRQLIRLLLALLNGAPPTIEDIRRYQQRYWGARTDKTPQENNTCIIELCSLAATNLKAKKNVDFDPSSFRETRIEIIKQRMRERKPRTVVMYGKSAKQHWDNIAEHRLVVDQWMRVGSTCMVFTPHPVSRGHRNSDWLRLAQRFREESQL